MTNQSRRLSLAEVDDLTRRSLSACGARLPGIRRHEFRRDAEQNGVEVPQELIDRLEAFAAG